MPELGIRADAPVRLRCGDVLVGTASVGRHEDRLVLTLDDGINRREDADDDRLGQ